MEHEINDYLLSITEALGAVGLKLTELRCDIDTIKSDRGRAPDLESRIAKLSDTVRNLLRQQAELRARLVAHQAEMDRVLVEIRNKLGGLPQ